VPLPPATPQTGDALRIRFRSRPNWAGSGATVDGGRFRLPFADGTCFFLDTGTATVWATWPEPLTLEDTATYLLGPVLGFYLRLQGHVCLHASAVVLDGRCIAFAGPAGSGKSTLAAGLATLGEAVLTEDVACLDERDGRLEIRPGYPRIRLWEGAAQLLPGSTGTLPLLTPNWDKRYLPLGDEAHRFHAEPAPLAAVFVLNPRKPMAEAAQIGPLSGQDVLTNLVVNTYGTRLLDTAMRAHEFQVLGRLAESVPVRSLTLNSDGTRLLEACEWIRNHAFR